MRIRGLFLHSNARGVPINFNRSFALQLLMEEHALLYSFMGLWPYSVTLQRKAKSTADIEGMEKGRMMWLWKRDSYNLKQEYLRNGTMVEVRCEEVSDKTLTLRKEGQGRGLYCCKLLWRAPATFLDTPQ